MIERHWQRDSSLDWGGIGLLDLRSANYRYHWFKWENNHNDDDWEVLTAAGQRGLLSGNIGYPASQVAQTATDKDTLVMELSSFQLMGVQEFHPEIAVITNLMPTHIDYFMVLLRSMWLSGISRTRWQQLISLYWTLTKIWQRIVYQNTSHCCTIFNKEKVDGAYLEDGQLCFRGEVVMAASEIGVPGSHNENALATIAVVKLVVWIIKPSRKLFQPLVMLNTVSNLWMKFRVKFYNDSKSTNILATQKALSGFDNSKVILIAGGLDCGNEFDELVPDITGLKKMVILGQSAERVKRAADKASVAYVDATDIADATARLMS